MYLSNLKVESDQLPKKAIVCGDPDRATLIAESLDNRQLLAKNREYYTYVGYYRNEYIAVVSHGVGSPGAAVCFEQLIQGGVGELIRVGTAGSYQKQVEPGSLVVSTAAVRTDGLTSQIVPDGFPAVADLKITNNLVAETENLYFPTFSGITLTLDVFYQGVTPFPHQQYQAAGVLAVEMEIAALYTIASIRNVRAGAIVAIDGYADADLSVDYNPHTDQMKNAIDQAAEIALSALTNA
ncbi:purine-nucleoside phosphorylase [Gracilibacillus salitolerans]|uniref:Uridine phosphorylase n=1 Tax=Gracilibacillus salitolerans TaxID=2663022 RepID=A0A5Q2TN05_9BACI|nr:nucleoside phosphorylase [Gracilibacillus salitolerans]QGH35393.1 purine-nucleoside phosphorylase [Gracilibacillus salitolerans]